MAVMSGGEVLARSLVQEGVEVVFGLPGVQLMGALDAFYRYQGEVRWITVRNEQSATYMAYGYARTTGRLGVAMVVPGPGALNAAAGLGTAYAASTPVLLLSGQVGTGDLGRHRGALHEVGEQMDVFRPITKACSRVLRVRDIPATLHSSVCVARSGRPRPVEMEVPWDVLDAEAEVEPLKPGPISQPELDVAGVRAAARRISAARHLVIWAGGGVVTADGSAELTALAHRLNAPVVTTQQGKGAIAEDDPLSVGVFYTNFGPARHILPQADVVLAVGSRLLLPQGTPWALRDDQGLVQIDVDPEEVGRNQPVQLGVVGDARRALAALLDEVGDGGKSAWHLQELEEVRARVRREVEAVAPTQLAIIDALRRELAPDAVVVQGVTNVAYWANVAFPVLRPRSYVTSSYFASLGYSFPAALGAKVGNPQRQVVALCGDGGFMYGVPELATAVQENINVVALVFVDNALGASRHDQQRRFGSRFLGTRLHNPSFARLAEEFGARGILVTGPEVGSALREALACKRPVVIEVPLPTLTPPFQATPPDV